MRKKKIKGKKEEENVCVVDGLFFGQIYLENGMEERREGRGQSENENLIMSENEICHDIVFL